MSAAPTWRLGWVALWAALLAVALWTRPPLPLDETRYLAVAWEMWVRGDFLVPHLNGAPYSHKPPLLFWLMHAGWALAGVNAWWPRLVPPLFALASLLLVLRMARLLWPERAAVGPRAAWLAAGALLWAVYATLLMFDPLVVFFATLGVLGAVEAACGRRSGWVAVALAVGLGLLAKGPAVLAWALPPALLAPWWAEAARRRPGRWYAALAAALAAGTALAAAWALPAAAAGGPEYARAILWGQTAGRVVDSFAHGRPWWWYLAWAPVFLLPWSLWAPAWAAWRRRGTGPDRGLRLCAAWALPGLVLFTFVSGKQPHYVLPAVPALALALAARLDGHAPGGRRAAAAPALALLALGAGLAAWLWGTATDAGAALLAGARPAWLLLPAAAGLALLARPGGVAALATAWATLLAALHLALAPGLALAYDTRPAARVLARLEAEGRPVAHAAKYHGQFHFAGRLRRPLEPVLAPGLAAWARAHPEGAAVVYYPTPALARRRLAEGRAAGAAPLFAGVFRGDGLVIWPARAIAAHPRLIEGAAGF